MQLPTEAELSNGFNDFSYLTFDLLEKIESNSKYLKFAAVNSQVALELFLKFWFVKKGKLREIQRVKDGKLLNNFINFSNILHLFYSSRAWSYGEKKEFVKLMEARNSIVHKAQTSDWNEELAKIIVRTLFFIHATAWSDFGMTLLFKDHLPHKVSKNKIWRSGAESFALDLSDIFDTEPHKCILCESRSVINGAIMALEEGDSEEDLICLNCLTSLNTEEQVNIIKCQNCGNEAYHIDILNEQNKQQYVGKCSECGEDTWVRKCKNCEIFYHPSDTNEVTSNGMYFCSTTCSQMHDELSA